MAGWDHLADVVPQECTALGVRIVENVPVKIFFVGCVATQACIDGYGVLTPNDGHRVTREFSCGDCGRTYRTSRTVSDTLHVQDYFGADGAYWLSVWIGVDPSLIKVLEN